MTISFEIIIVNSQNNDQKDEEYNFIETWALESIGDIFNVTETDLVTTDIMKNLYRICGYKNCNDVILIIGNLESVERHIITKAIGSVIDTENLSTYIITYLLKIETRLKDIMSYKTICGIRNQTLIIDLSGQKNVQECLKAIADVILLVVYLIRKDKANKPLYDLTSDGNFTVQGVASISKHDSTKQGVASTLKDYSTEQGVASTSRDYFTEQGVASTSKDYFTEQVVASTSDDDFTDEEDAQSAGLKRYKDFTSPETSPSAGIIKRRKESSPVHSPVSPSLSFPVISILDALFKVREVTSYNMNVKYEMVPLNEAYGRILCEEVEAIYDLPPFRTSTKHGYVVLVKDGEGLRILLNEENINSSTSLKSGTCVWVNSGAPIPDGAGREIAVIPVKDTRRIEIFDCKEIYIEIMIKPKSDQNIKPIGHDIFKGQIIAKPFRRIGPNDIGLLAASGRKEILAAKHISIGVLSIGSNLQNPETEPLKKGFVYDGNRLTIISLLKANGFDALDCGIVINEQSSIVKKIMEVLKTVDLLVTTGSSNVKDLMKIVLIEYYHAKIHFGNICMKPGKSTIFATCKLEGKTKYFLCLSGNLSTAFISAHVFLLPLVNELCCNYAEQLAIPVRLENQYTLHSRSRVAWTIVEWNDKQNIALAFSNGNAISDKLINAVNANALLFLPKKEIVEKDKEHKFSAAILIKLPKKITEKNFCNASPKPSKRPRCDKRFR